MLSVICVCENYLHIQFSLSNSIESDTRALHLPCEVYVACGFEMKMWCSSVLSTTPSYFSRVLSPVSQKLMSCLDCFLTVETLVIKSIIMPTNALI